MSVEFEGVTPILRVANLDASVDYYLRVLGFKLNWRKEAFACVSRDRCHIFLSEGDQGRPGAWLWIGVTDAGALFAELSERGAKIRHPLSNYDWAYEMQVEDPDGNVLRMGSEPKDAPLCDEWLDMHGVLWKQLPSGGWVRADR